MKRLLSILCASVLLLCGLTACGSGTASVPSSDKPDESSKGGFRVVASIFPEYDWVKNILGDNPAGADLTLLLDNGVDMHSYQPSAADIVKISACDLFIYVGGESDEWVDDALQEASNKDMIVLNLMDILGDNAKEEERVEGMEDDGEEEDGPSYDEHVWLSLNNAGLCCGRIADALETLDPANAETYRVNADAYMERLNDLDILYQNAVSGAEKDTLLFADRFPFRYMTDDYGLRYYAAFPGCSAETEASFSTITFLAGKADELGLSAILTIDGSDQRMARTIVENTKTKDQRVLTLNSMQSVTRRQAGDGLTYLSVMEDNLRVLEEALS